MTDAAIPAGGTEVLDPPWDPWRPADIARLPAGVTVPWYVAGGWAIDLFIGRQTREHGDLEIAIPASAFPTIRSVLADYEFDVVGSGRRWPLEKSFCATVFTIPPSPIKVMAEGWISAWSETLLTVR